MQPVDVASRSLGGWLQGMDAVERYFTVAKRIALFLARTSSQHTIDHLVYEISRQISEDDDTVPAISSETGVSTLTSRGPEPASTCMPGLCVCMCVTARKPGSDVAFQCMSRFVTNWAGRACRM